MAAPKKNFVWTDEEVELLLRATLDYKTTKTLIGIDWESCQTKYQDIWTSFMEQYPTPTDGEQRPVAFPHPPTELTKQQVTTKLKAIRGKYREAIDSQRRSGHGRVIALYFELCHSIWSGSPATTSLDFGIETAELNNNNNNTENELSPSSVSQASAPEEEGSAESAETPLQRRRGVLQVT